MKFQEHVQEGERETKTSTSQLERQSSSVAACMTTSDFVALGVNASFDRRQSHVFQ